MKRKEIKQLAEKILRLEKIIQESNDKEEISAAKAEIVRLGNNVKSLEDIFALDELIQKELEKNT